MGKKNAAQSEISTRRKSPTRQSLLTYPLTELPASHSTTSPRSIWTNSKSGTRQRLSSTSDQVAKRTAKRRRRTHKRRECKTRQSENASKEAKVPPERIEDIPEVSAPHELAVEAAGSRPADVVDRQGRNEPCLPSGF